MSARVSIGTMVKQISGLAPADLSDWELKFVRSIERVTDQGRNTQPLSERQIAIVERIWEQHFA